MADPTMSPDELWQAYAQEGVVQEPTPIAAGLAPESQAASEEQMLAQQKVQKRRKRRRAEVEQRPVPNMAMVRQKLACNQAELDMIRTANQQGLLGLGQGPKMPLGLDFKSLIVGAAVGAVGAYFWFGLGRKRA